MTPPMALRSLLVLSFSLVASSAVADEGSTRLEALLMRVDDLWRGAQSEAVLAMNVKTEHYAREMRMRAWSKGKERSLVVILAPRKEKGTATLKSDSHIYTYLPKTHRTIRLGAGTMGSSWMGSHFTNDDLVKESRLFDDYDAKLIFEGAREDETIIEIELIPKPDAAVVWGKVILEIDAESELPRAQRYYDEDMALARTISFFEPRDLGDRRVPSRLRVQPADAPDEFTEIIYEKIDFQLKLDDDFFSIRRLERSGR